MKCINCKNGEMKVSLTTYYKKVGSNYIIIENVPCMVCSFCGEITYSMKTLESIERMIEKMHIAEKANIVEYDIAA